MGQLNLFANRKRTAGYILVLLSIAALTLLVYGRGPITPVSRIAYEANDRIYVIDIDGTHRRRVGPKGAKDPAWSPNGKRIAFRDTSLIRTMRANGKDIKAVHKEETPPWLLRDSLQWSPRGNSIVYREQPIFMPSAENHLKVIDIESSREKYKEIADLESVDWSPDGKQIAATVDSGYPKKETLLIMNADGSNVRTIFRTRLITGGPAWSPNNRYIALAQGNKITIVSLRKKNAIQTIRPKIKRGNIYAIDWSPDSKRFVFEKSFFIERKNKIYVMDTDGSNPKYLVSGKSPRWSPFLD